MMNAADAASVRAQQSDRLRSELDRMVSQYNFALERKYSMPGVAQVLDELTRLLPDDTWLTQFEMKSSIRGKATQREVFMRGESANAGKLISLLENATLVGNAAPRSPTTKLQPGPGESFDIGAQLKSVPPPQKIALTEALPAPHANPQPAPVAVPAPVADAKAARPANPAAPEAAAAPAAQPEGAAAARPAPARAGAREGGGGGRGRRHLLRGGTREAEAPAAPPAATKSAPPPAAEPAAQPPAAAEGMQNAEPAEPAPAEGGGDEPGGGDDNGEESQ
jgi:general secretion pathway protein L